MLEEWPNHC